MTSIKEIIHVLKYEQVREEEREQLDLLLQERAEDILATKQVVIQLITEANSILDCSDLAEKMREAESDNVTELIQELVNERLKDITGKNIWLEVIVEDKY